jgi:hypothetical protein
MVQLIVVDILMELMVVEKSDGVANLGVGQLRGNILYMLFKRIFSLSMPPPPIYYWYVLPYHLLNLACPVRPDISQETRPPKKN